MATTFLLCSACGTTKVSVDGTWYSVTDATMYNFADGEITVSGVTVGQYEDNGDSVVISLMDSNENLQLYIASMSDVIVLADVQSGDGKVYFCKGYENAQAIIEDAEKTSHQISMKDRATFEAYLENNLTGVWVADNQNKNVVKMEFSGGVVTKTDKYGNSETLYILADPLGRSFPVVVIEDGVPQAKIYVSENKDGSDAGYISITLTDETYTENRVEIYSWTFTKQ